MAWPLLNYSVVSIKVHARIQCRRELQSMMPPYRIQNDDRTSGVMSCRPGPFSQHAAAGIHDGIDD
jgi:hypothetical protein